MVLADDSGIFREGLRLLLQAAGVEVLAGVGSPVELESAVATHQPDVAVVDVRLPPTFTDEGIQAAVTLHRRWPRLGVLVLSTEIEPGWLTALLEAVPSGIGYLLKDRVADAADLVDALQRVAAGGIALDPQVVQVMITARRTTGPIERLTPRERDVLALLAEGRSNVGIGRSLHLSTKTVESHIAAIFRSLNLDNAELENRRVTAAITYLRSTPRTTDTRSS